jgi:hypothetical protein
MPDAAANEEEAHADTDRSERRPQAPPPLFPTVSAEAIRAAFAKAPGNEFSSGKMASPESSAALVANAFGFFLDRPADLPRPPTLPAAVGWPPTRIGLEECARFPWQGGRHPWLDALVETPSHLVGVESKRYEPFRPKAPPSFSAAFWREVWGDGMRPFEAARDRLHDDPARYTHLDAAQLVKHAFGLRTLASRTGPPRRRPFLLYLYAEPAAWPDGRPVAPEAIRRHDDEVRAYAEAVSGAEVGFAACTYRAFLSAMAASASGDVRQHAVDLGAAYRL